MIVNIALIVFIVFREIVSYKERMHSAELLYSKSLTEYRSDEEIERAKYTTPSRERLRKQNGE